jgi:hypothetical protein
MLLPHDRPGSLCEALDRLLDTGVVVVGDAKLSVANVDLIYLRLQLVLASVDSLGDTHASDGMASPLLPAYQSEPVNRKTEDKARKYLPEKGSATLPADEMKQAEGPAKGEPVSSHLSEGQRAKRDSSRPDNGLMQLALTLIKLLHELLEKQAVRRMERGSLTDDETERLGCALMQQAEELQKLCTEFGIDDKDLNLDLGPLGKLR